MSTRGPNQNSEISIAAINANVSEIQILRLLSIWLDPLYLISV